MNKSHRCKFKMPKTREEFEQYLISAYMAGCNFGYGIEHTCNVVAQEQIGAEYYIGKISEKEYYERLEEIRGY